MVQANGWLVSLGKRLWLWTSGLLNAYYGGDRAESFSSRSWRESLSGDERWLRVVKNINRVFFWQSNHCRGAYAAYKERGGTL